MNIRARAKFALIIAMAIGVSHARAGFAIAQGASQINNASDTLGANYVPAGFGSLKQDDIAIKITLPGGLQVAAIPLDERVIRLLAPDVYSTMSQVKQSNKRKIDSIANRVRLQGTLSLWYVRFFGVEQGEARFSPQEFVISNVGRDFRPINIIPLTSGFADYRLKQREVQYALFVFDSQLDLNQPLTAKIEGNASATNWQDVLRRIEQERAQVRSRAAAKTP
ncbi:MAG: hypothetical protein ABI852_01955 [Gemmatimonadaceae bacterium]